MNKKHHTIDRRRFLTATGAVTLGSALVSSESRGLAGQSGKSQAAKFPQVSKRRLGRTGVDIPILALGCVFDFTKLHHILDGALQYGLVYWDSSTSYGGGRSLLGIGQYLEKHPGLRKSLFLVSKPPDIRTAPPVIEDVEKDLHETLEQTKTDHFDVYCAVHALKDPNQLTPELKKWSEDCKRRGLFKYAGFSVHANMTQALQAAVKAGWIDVVLTAYNFQFMQDAEYMRAIDAAHKAGIGLIAIKTQRKPSLRPMDIETEADKKLTAHFLEKGFTPGQAKLRVVLEDERFTAASVGMDDLGILAQNVAAALNRTQLSERDRAALAEYAAATGHTYCTGCSRICHAAAPDVPCIGDIMRYVMYHDSYGHTERARDLFALIPSDVRARLLSADYSRAEARCPSHLPISRIVREAVGKLA